MTPEYVIPGPKLKTSSIAIPKDKQARILKELITTVLDIWVHWRRLTLRTKFCLTYLKTLKGKRKIPLAYTITRYISYNNLIQSPSMRHKNDKIRARKDFRDQPVRCPSFRTTSVSG